mmetsp:Transcript_108009/g.271721  ORF Transcript_108009/g.271721 Transcript_108009/m.271721 type:complete len:229 (+) Transcript_108009:396-1082(+)
MAVGDVCAVAAGGDIAREAAALGPAAGGRRKGSEGTVRAFQRLAPGEGIPPTIGSDAVGVGCVAGGGVVPMEEAATAAAAIVASPTGATTALQLPPAASGGGQPDDGQPRGKQFGGGQPAGCRGGGGGNPTGGAPGAAAPGTGGCAVGELAVVGDVASRTKGRRAGFLMRFMRGPAHLRALASRPCTVATETLSIGGMATPPALKRRVRCQAPAKAKAAAGVTKLMKA